MLFDHLITHLMRSLFAGQFLPVKTLEELFTHVRLINY